MEWVETTGKTVEEAKDAALDQLGVDEQDAEFEVLEEPRAGLFGRTRGEARVRARIQPTVPRPKVERRDRRGRDRQGRSGAQGRSRQDQKAAASAPTAASGEDAPAEEAAGSVAVETVEVGDAAEAAQHQARNGGGQRRSRRGGRGNGGGTGRRDHEDRDDDEGSTEMSEAELLEQGESVKGFLLDLLDAFGLDGEVAISTADDGAVELAVTGPDLGLLIGPKGNTLQAIQELSRSALQRQKPGEAHAKVRIDVAGYRQRRREALERFTRDVAEQVRESGVQKALEPMSPPDRKVVHDTVNDIDGVTTISEGEDHRRRVVILPA
jgi:spoIIIJ-associated protein